jgi:hypothetical protein
VTVPRIFFTPKFRDVFDPEALQVIPRPTVVALHQLSSVVLPAADAENLFPIAVGKGLHMQPSPCSDNTDGLLGEQGRTGICGVTWYKNLLQAHPFSVRHGDHFTTPVLQRWRAYAIRLPRNHIFVLGTTLGARSFTVLIQESPDPLHPIGFLRCLQLTAFVGPNVPRELFVWPVK